jgi:hypothetical protein
MPQPDAYAVVRQAILDRRQIVTDYKGHRRLLCPHCIGTKHGRPQALFFQFGGGGNRDLPPGGEWRCMAIDRMANIESPDGEWHSRGDYVGAGSCIDEVDVEVEP